MRLEHQVIPLVLLDAMRGTQDGTAYGKTENCCFVDSQSASTRDLTSLRPACTVHIQNPATGALKPPTTPHCTSRSRNAGLPSTMLDFFTAVRAVLARCQPKRSIQISTEELPLSCHHSNPTPPVKLTWDQHHIQCSLHAPPPLPSPPYPQRDKTTRSSRLAYGLAPAHDHHLHDRQQPWNRGSLDRAGLDGLVRSQLEQVIGGQLLPRRGALPCKEKKKHKNDHVSRDKFLGNGPEGAGGELTSTACLRQSMLYYYCTVLYCAALRFAGVTARRWACRHRPHCPLIPKYCSSNRDQLS